MNVAFMFEEKLRYVIPRQRIIGSMKPNAGILYTGENMSKMHIAIRFIKE